MGSIFVRRRVKIKYSIKLTRENVHGDIFVVVPSHFAVRTIKFTSRKLNITVVHTIYVKLNGF